MRGRKTVLTKVYRTCRCFSVQMQNSGMSQTEVYLSLPIHTRHNHFDNSATIICSFPCHRPLLVNMGSLTCATILVRAAVQTKARQAARQAARSARGRVLTTSVDPNENGNSALSPWLPGVEPWPFGWSAKRWARGTNSRWCQDSETRRCLENALKNTEAWRRQV